jgi:hypothetical protein
MTQALELSNSADIKSINFSILSLKTCAPGHRPSGATSDCLTQAGAQTHIRPLQVEPSLL